MITKGLSFSQERFVREEDTALALGSGKLGVYATPALVAFMENCAMQCIENVLNSNEDSVGVEICVKHIKATKVGAKVFCRAEVTEIEGRKIAFDVKAWDENGDIGIGTHSRFIINPERFMNKL